MNGKDKLSIIPFTFFFFLGLYVVIKFFLVTFWTLNFNPPLILELTPFFLFDMNPVQLFILSAIVAGSDAYLHFKNHGKNIVYSFVPTVLMLIGIGSAIYVYEWNNPLYYLLFAIMLGVTVVDHRYLLHVNGYFKETEEEVIVSDRERLLEEEVRALRKELMRLKREEMQEKGEYKEFLEAEEIEEALEEMPEEERSKLEELPEIPKEYVEKIEREKEKLETLVPSSAEAKEAEKEEKTMEELEELIEELLEYREKKKELAGKECPVCGAMNPEDAKYCKECGSELEGGK